MSNQELIFKYESLPDPIKKEVDDLLEQLIQEHSRQENQEPSEEEEEKPFVRRGGTLRGVIGSIADDFNEPLEDFKDYM